MGLTGLLGLSGLYGLLGYHFPTPRLLLDINYT